MLNIGVIGYGARIQGVMREMNKHHSDVQIAAITDPRNEMIQAELALTGTGGSESIRYYQSPEEMLNCEKLDGIMIGTRCSLHTDIALNVFPSRLPIFLEKPVATNMPDLLRLKKGWEEQPCPVIVSFPLRVTSIVQFAKEIIDSGKIGTIEHVQAVNNVPYGGVYFQDWYRDEDETGGLFLQKATHDFDYLTYLLGQKPVSVCAMTSKQIFKGDKPAALKCVDCEEKRTCPDSSLHNGHANWQSCCYAVDTGNEDSGSALIRYENGLHLSYSQNFFVRRDAGSRGARLMGYKGTLEFDFYTGMVKVYMHHTSRVETYEINKDAGHFGGDKELTDSFVDMMYGTGPSVSTLEDGLVSALLCLKAKESALTNTFQDIVY